MTCVCCGAKPEVRYKKRPFCRLCKKAVLIGLKSPAYGWSVTNWITTVMMAVLGVAIIATIAGGIPKVNDAKLR